MTKRGTIKDDGKTAVPHPQDVLHVDVRNNLRAGTESEIVKMTAKGCVKSHLKINHVRV